MLRIKEVTEIKDEKITLNNCPLAKAARETERLTREAGESIKPDSYYDHPLR